MKIVKYFGVGGIAAIVDITIFFIFAKLVGIHYLLVGTVGFLIATYVNYILSIKHVFESGNRYDRKREIQLVYFVSGVGLFLHQIILYISIDIFYFELMLSKILATGLVFFWNYFSRKYFIF